MSRLPGSAVSNSLTLPSYLATFAAQRRHGGQTQAESKQRKGREQSHGVKLLVAISLGLAGRRDRLLGLS